MGHVELHRGCWLHGVIPTPPQVWIEIMVPSQRGRLLSEVINTMAEKALEDGGQADMAIERFSAGIDRLLAWLPGARREEVLELAKSHGYCTPQQIARMRDESLRPH